MNIDMTKLRMLYGSLIRIREALVLASELFYKTLDDRRTTTSAHRYVIPCGTTSP